MVTGRLEVTLRFIRPKKHFPRKRLVRLMEKQIMPLSAENPSVCSELFSSLEVKLKV